MTAMAAAAAERQLIVAVEGTAAVGPFWQTVVSDYLEKAIRSFCGNDSTSQKLSATNANLSLVVFNSHDPHSAFLVQRSGWMRDVDVFFQWLSSIPFAGGSFSDAAIAEGLAEALMMFSCNQILQNLDGQRHCILVAASNPYPFPTPVYRPRQNLEQSRNTDIQTDGHLSDAETIAKSFAQCNISLSVICPNQLPKLKAIYNAGMQKLLAPDPPVDNVKNPHFLVLISENFLEARAALSHSGITNLSTQGPIKVYATSLAFFPGPPPASVLSANTGSVMNRRPGSVGTIPPATVKIEPTTVTSMTGPTYPHMMGGIGASHIPSGTGTMMPTTGMSQEVQSGMQPLGVNDNAASDIPLYQQTSSTLQSAQSKYAKVWEGNLSGQMQGQRVFITRLEGYRSASASETLAANWPPTMEIVRLISEDHMKNKKYARKADFLVFRAMIQHGFLSRIREMKLCAVIKLPSQTLLLSVSDKASRLIGMVFRGEMVVLLPQIPSLQQQQQDQQLQAQQHSQLQLEQVQQQHLLGQLQQQQQHFTQLQHRQQMAQLQQQQLHQQQHQQLQAQQPSQL